MENIIYGIHAVQAFLEHNIHKVLNAYLLKNKCVMHYKNNMYVLYKKLKNYGCNIKIVNKKFLDKKTNGATHQGIMISIQSTKSLRENDLENILTRCHLPLLLVLDRVVDPHNLGACLRCADATNVNAVIISKNKSAPLNDTAKKVASGAAENVPLIRVTNLARTLNLLYHKYNINIIGTDNKSRNFIYKNKLIRPLALVIGSEENGIQHLIKKCCNKLVGIPMNGVVSSLNVSIAAGICLYEIMRQNKLK